MHEILKYLPKVTDQRFYNEGLDDSMVYKLNDDLAIVQTVDFITPVLNDPFAFGAVAAANSLSDIYAMGATPVFALNLVCFPVKSLPLSILTEVLKGGASVATDAGITVAGGHSIEDNAPKYGMSVTGTAKPSQLVYKKGAKPGDFLFLTKPLGSGIITTAIDRNLAGKELEDKIYRVMVHLNKGAAAAMTQVGVHACTDVTGFGLLGHLYEMLTASNVSARINKSMIPVMDDVEDLARSGVVPAGSHNNYRYLSNKVNWSQDLSREARIVLCDAQTSGGLLISVPPDKSDRLQEALLENGCIVAAKIGEVVEKSKDSITVLP